MELSVQEICRITDGTLLCGDGGVMIRHLSFDSRDIPEDCLFIPTIGARVDGHDFIGGAFDKGAAAALTSRGDIIRPDRPHIRVADTQKALEALGCYARSQFHGPVVGITGSVGKTTTRELTKAALAAGGSVTGTVKNMNSQIGTPVILYHMDQTADRAVMEMGISAPGEMKDLVALVHPTLAVVTNIGVSHIEYLGSREGICAEKMHITDELGPEAWAVLNGDEPLLRAYREKLPCRVLTYGLQSGNDLIARDIQEGDGVTFTAVFDSAVTGYREVPVTLLIPGVHNVMNALAALGAAFALGIDPALAALSMGTFSGFSRRLERKLLGGLTLIDDSYNASPPSMKAALSVLDKASGHKKIALLADMLELGDNGPALHREVGGFAAGLSVDTFILFGELVREMAPPLRAAGKNVILCDTREEALQQAVKTAKAGDVMLLKGSNSMGLDKIAAALPEF
ncbi:MAG: UDP-N-acetylmuramoyl-tripeptide--D-alanyl-D-alanine ligase [Lachnospiraceae bacterium]|nr:UDP-N-acetylmuramoyl-tripeptide--D-alanyl-D-alanine ligase [Lachnospiraceae bacterium]